MILPPLWGFSFFNRKPAVETAGYFLPRLRRCFLSLIFHTFRRFILRKELKFN